MIQDEPISDPRSEPARRHANAEPDRGPGEEIDSAVALRREDKLPQSIELLRDVLRRFPNDIAVMLELAISLRLAGECDTSLATSARAIELDRTSIPALRVHADTNIHFNRREIALATIEQAGALASKNTRMQLKKGRLLVQLGRPDEGAASLSALLDGMTPDAPERGEIELELAEALREAGRYEESLAAAAAVLEREPQNQTAWLQRIETHAHFLLLEEALSAADEALSALPRSQPLLICRAMLLRKAGLLIESDRLLTDARPETPALQLARLESDVALGRIDSALPALRTRWSEGDQTVRTALCLIRAYRLAGDLPEARAFAETAIATLTDAPPLWATLLDLCLDMGDDEARDRVLDALPVHARTALPVRRALTRIAVNRGDFEAAASGHLDVAGGTAVPDAEVEAVLFVLRNATSDRDAVHAILNGLNDLLDRKAACLPAVTVSALRAKVLATVLDWKTLYPLVASLERAQPRNLALTALRARAAFELARFDEAETSALRILESNPVDRATIRLHNTILQLRGEIDRYFDINVGRAENPAAVSETDYIELAKNMFLAGRNEQASDLLRNAPPHLHKSDKIAFERRLLTGEVEAVSSPHRPTATRQSPQPQPKERLERLLDLNDEKAVAGDVLLPGFWIAWMLSGNSSRHFETWRRTILDAENTADIIRRAPHFIDPPRQLQLEDDYSALTDRMRDRLPTLIVTSHSGPAMLPFLVEQYDSLRYLLQPFQKDWAILTEGRSIHYGGQRNETAVEIIRNLRQGNSIYSLPDLPIGTVKMHDPTSLAVGRLFGFPYPILDTVPKISRAMRIPTFWVQPIWRKGKIHIDVAQLPMAEPDEPEGTWCARWAQSYLDELAKVLTSGPENQSLSLAIWRYFLLNGFGPAALRHAEKTVGRQERRSELLRGWALRWRSFVNSLELFK
ncbi:tetratricopeptide repeat protein [Breoghania sp. JC706]|uniref:tetratricopeptide repeat protein n=1 Tax=Breoghania sp. JC706 TaxID=3117732 RepID=UPI00300808DA